MGRNDCDVLIAGGGNVGAALALALCRQGLSVTLVEAQPPVVDDGADVGLRVSALGQGSRNFIYSLGAWPVADQRGPTAYRRMQVQDASGRGALDFQAHEHGLSALGWIIDNLQLQACLWAEAEAQGVRLLRDVRVDDIRVRQRAVSVRLDDGSEQRAGLLVAADGARSPIRRQLDIPVSERDYQQRAIVAVVETEHPNPEVAWQRFLPDGPLAFLPVTRGRSSIVWSLPGEGAEDRLGMDDNDFLQALTAASESRFGRVTAVGPRAGFPLSMMLARRYIHERVVLVGDAAHRVHPLAGQGLNIGLQDAAALAEILHEPAVVMADTADLQRSLRRYERWRRSDDELIVRGVDVIGQLMRGAGLRAGVAGLGLNVVNRAWPLKDAFLRRACGLVADAPSAFRRQCEP